jgi:type I restriction enzyme S subunit
MSRSKLFGGEILIGKIGNAGRVYYMPKLNSPSSLAMNLFALRFNVDVNKYIHYHLLSSFSRQEISKYVKGVGNPTIDKNSIRSLSIALPSYEEQHQIVQEIESRLSVADKMAESIAQSLQQAEALRQSILKKAFSGELV